MPRTKQPKGVSRAVRQSVEEIDGAEAETVKAVDVAEMETVPAYSPEAATEVVEDLEVPRPRAKRARKAACPDAEDPNDPASASAAVAAPSNKGRGRGRNSVPASWRGPEALWSENEGRLHAEESTPEPFVKAARGPRKQKAAKADLDSPVAAEEKLSANIGPRQPRGKAKTNAAAEGCSKDAPSQDGRVSLGDANGQVSLGDAALLGGDQLGAGEWIEPKRRRRGLAKRGADKPDLVEPGFVGRPDRLQKLESVAESLPPASTPVQTRTRRARASPLSTLAHQGSTMLLPEREP